MATSQNSPEKKIPDRDFYQVVCQIRFLAEAIPTWVRDDFSPSEDAAYGIAIILSDIADQAARLEPAVKAQTSEAKHV